MKVNTLKGILFSIVMLSCLVIVGCNNAKDNINQNESMETVQNKNGIVTAISILEHGGEDGRVNDWKVYQEEDKYLLSYLDFRVHFNDEAEPEIFEITEHEYNELMSLDYAKYISEYNPSDWENVADAIYFQSVITYENGVEESTQALMTSATIKLNELLRKYDN
ncbi:MAG: hypothetical protein K2I06_05430 [Ruminococcus sp.]|nr:hypothetical protein [Ruminococcus sp.]